MAKKKVSFAAPTVDSAKSTLVMAGSAGAGFLGGRFLGNKVPQANSTLSRAALALLALGVHSSVKGSGDDAEAIRGVSLGFGVHQISKLADEAGQKLLVKRDNAGGSEGMNGVLDAAAAALTEGYVPKGDPTLVIEDATWMNGPFDTAALNTPMATETAVSGALS